jgi:hypothetical protein
MASRFIALVLLLLAGSALADESRFKLINDTGYPIAEITLSPSQINDWSVNVLKPPVIKQGEFREVVVPWALNDCHQDLKVVFANVAAQPMWQYIDLCDLRKIRLHYDATSGITTASYEY